MLSDYHERIKDNELDATNQNAARSRVYGDQLHVMVFHGFWGVSVRDLVLFVTKAVDPKVT